MLILHHPSQNKTKQNKKHAQPISGKYTEYLNEALPLLVLKEYLEKRTICGPEVSLRSVRSHYYN